MSHPDHMYPKNMPYRDRQNFDGQVENQALLNMVGIEFDMMGFILEKAIVRNALKTKYKEITT